MIGTDEAYAAADALLARAANTVPVYNAALRNVVALAYLQGVTDGVHETEAISAQAFSTLNAKVES